MESLIWYSVSGVFVVVTAMLIRQPSFDSPVVALGMAFLIPASGFGFHQFMRALFTVNTPMLCVGGVWHGRMGVVS